MDLHEHTAYLLKVGRQDGKHEPRSVPHLRAFLRRKDVYNAIRNAKTFEEGVKALQHILKTDEEAKAKMDAALTNPDGLGGAIADLTRPVSNVVSGRFFTGADRDAGGDFQELVKRGVKVILNASQDPNGSTVDAAIEYVEQLNLAPELKRELEIRLLSFITDTHDSVYSAMEEDAFHREQKRSGKEGWWLLKPWRKFRAAWNEMGSGEKMVYGFIFAIVCITVISTFV